jgi:hypothetical protein
MYRLIRAFQILLGQVFPRELLGFSKRCKLLFRRKHVLPTSIPVGKRYAIVVHYLNYSPITNLIKLIELLESNDIVPLLVINSNNLLHDLDRRLTQKNLPIILRINFGSDFGAYKDGYKYLRKCDFFQDIKELFFVNDSIVYTERACKFLELIVSKHGDHNCIWLHRQGTVHASSTLLRFEMRADTRRKLNVFWTYYFPWESKHLRVRLGEHFLTRLFTPTYFKAAVDKVVLNHKTFSKMKPHEITQFLYWLKKSNIDEDKINSLLTLLENHKYQDLTLECINLFQQSNSLGFYLCREFGVPIKFDVLRSSLVRKSDLRLYLSSINNKDEWVEEFKYFVDKPLKF